MPVATAIGTTHHMQTDEPDSAEATALRALRSLIPNRALTLSEALQIAEQQAETLLRISAVTTPPVPSSIVASQPRITVVHDLTPLRSLSYWNGSQWVIAINERTPYAHRRMALLREYAWIIWHGHDHLLPDTASGSTSALHLVAARFASTTLIPAGMLSAAWSKGEKHIGSLARRFEVTEHAVLNRILDVGLTLARPSSGGMQSPTTRGATPPTTPRSPDEEIR